MSVLIKDMDKPKACRDCPFMTGGWCRVWSDDETKLTDANLLIEKPDWCPLVEIPTPHGRLGDLDELKSRFRHSEGDSDVDSAWISTIRRFITQADIIIEAEGREVTE